MSVRPTHHGTAVVAALLLPATVLLALSGTAHAAGTTPADLPQPQVAAIAEAGTVYLSGSWGGYVAVPTDSGEQWSPLLEADFSCSGFVASSDGYVVTAGHCADIAEGKKALVDEYLSELVQSGDITADQAGDLIAGGAENAFPVEGAQAGSPPVLTSKVYPAISIGGSGNFQGYDATLVDDRPLAQGDVALLKVDPPSPLPVLAVASAQPQAGDTIDAIGYPGDVTALVGDSVQPTFAKGQISGRQQTSAGPFTQVGVAMSAGMSGGPVVNGQGEVVGTVSFGPSDDTQQLNFASTEDTVQALLARNGVKNSLSSTDQQYRKGMSEYFGGHFHAASADLGAVVNSAPTQVLAQQYKEKAIADFPDEKLAAPAPRVHHATGLPMVAVLGGVGGLLVVALAVLALVFRRRRGGPAGDLAVTSTAPTPPSSPASVPLHVPSPTSPAAAAPVPGPWSSPVAGVGASGGGGTALLEAPVAGRNGHDPSRYCMTCGAEHSPGSRFCTRCGSALA